MGRHPLRIFLAAVVLLGFGWAGDGSSAENPPSSAGTDEEAAYTRAITQRAERILGPLEIGNAAKAARVRNIITEQYRGLREIHDERDARIAAVRDSLGDSTTAETRTSAIREEADRQVVTLHRRFIARLLAELTPGEVDQVKDGMTYGVVPITYNRYTELLPELTKEQRATIRAHLLEAREYAMDAGSSEEKHAIFNQYKGRINNYLSAAGYDLKQAERDWAARQ